jgi:hypothetical protein
MNALDLLPVTDVRCYTHLSVPGPLQNQVAQLLAPPHPQSRGLGEPEYCEM